MPAANELPGNVKPSGMLVTGELANDVANGDASPWTVLNDGVNMPGLPVRAEKTKKKRAVSKKCRRVGSVRRGWRELRGGGHHGDAKFGPVRYFDR